MLVLVANHANRQHMLLRLENGILKFSIDYGGDNNTRWDGYFKRMVDTLMTVFCVIFSQVFIYFTTATIILGWTDISNKRGGCKWGQMRKRNVKKFRDY